MDDRVVITLFRHGITEANVRRAYLGWTDSPLCPGEPVLMNLKEHDIYFSSDLPRCTATLNLVFPQAHPYLLSELREMNFGDWEGKTYEELKDEPRYEQWLTDPSRYSPPNGESYQQFSERVQAGWRKLVQMVLTQTFERCAVMTHGGVIRYLLSEYAPEIQDFWSWQVPHSQGFELAFNRNGLRRGERCTLLQVVPLTEKKLG
ncbi:histidine phosphatase family protein [Neobacillus sp. LXY-1]|uniref:histidine phosphatase family protein n=1 Tax=Neobacillus sp. LXY-1 TaxID=3379133 RepID=UPI003EE19D53